MCEERQSLLSSVKLELSAWHCVLKLTVIDEVSKLQENFHCSGGSKRLFAFLWISFLNGFGCDGGLRVSLPWL